LRRALLKDSSALGGRGLTIFATESAEKLSGMSFYTAGRRTKSMPGGTMSFVLFQKRAKIGLGKKKKGSD